ncbi:MAG: hypothetical protein E7013_05300 [Alphaproteobacteria bacterium]|nr:hypothetical protein [Alphaproteobacteria bacterium]
MKYKISINQDILKIVALVAMTIDHIALIFPTIPFDWMGRYIGRISFPIFAFLLMKHLNQYQIYKKYVVRLGFFGILSYFILKPFQIHLGFPLALPLNILLSFLFAVLTLKVFSFCAQKKMNLLLKIIFSAISFLIFSFLAFGAQYGVIGFCYLLLLYFYFQKPNKYKTFLILFCSFFLNVESYQGVISFIMTYILLKVDFNKVYPRLIKHWCIFYLYYPLHLLLLASIAYFLKY